jgi:hypothetical protein
LSLDHRDQQEENRFARDSSLPFLNTYRTMCLSPDAAFLEVIEQVGALRIAA